MRRCLLAISALGLIGGLASSPAWAVTPPGDATATQGAAAPVVDQAPAGLPGVPPLEQQLPTLAPDSLPAAIRDALVRPMLAPAAERSWVSAVTTFYEARQFAPLWVGDTGLNAKGAAIAAEFTRAADWGLDPDDYRLPRLADLASTAQRAQAEVALSLAALGYASHAQSGRIDPSKLSKWLEATAKPFAPASVLSVIAEATDPAAALLTYHPLHPGFEKLRQAYLKARGVRTEEPAATATIVIPDGPKLRPGDAHPDIALVRKRLDVAAAPAGDDVYDNKLAKAVSAFMADRTGKRTTTIDQRVRRLLSERDQPERKSTGKAQLDRYLVNLERWRWLPRDLGQRHVWNNLPSYETQVFADGREIHRERIIIGAAATQTPVFSDRMEFVVFRPEWGVPPSLKVKDLLPRLQGGDTSVLAARDMRILGNQRLDWSRVDIRTIAIVQNAGPSNPLGMMKFMFPNKHDVYMHDTPTKNLFSQPTRAISNGCIRVRNPQELADLIFSGDKGWSPAEVSRVLKQSPDNNKIDLSQPVPVHNVYFTAVADANGAVQSYGDVYGHDARVADALNGKSIASIAARDPAVAHERKIKQLMEASSSRAARYASDDGWFFGAPPFGYGGGGGGYGYSGGGGGGGGSGSLPPWARSVFGYR